MRGIGAFVALFSAGCSLGFVAGPPPQHAEVAAFTCSDSLLAPILDSVLGGLVGSTFLAAAGSTDEKWEMDSGSLGSRSDVIAIYGALAALEAASAFYGYRTVHACREARRVADDRVEHAMQTLPPRWPPPPGAGAPGS